MIRSLTLAVAAFLLCAGAVVAQPLCGFDHSHQQLMTQSPGYTAKVQQSVSNWIQYQQAAQTSLVQQTVNGPFYEIPVVVHVLRPVTSTAINAYNPSDAQIQRMINYLNGIYAAQWPGAADTFSGGTYFPVKFVLAKRDTACNPTTGIVRAYAGGVPGYASDGVSHGTVGAPDAAVKAVSRWPNSEYYNIWIVSKIDGEDGITSTGPYTAGYAYFPGAPSDVDGTIMLASQADSGEVTLPHEIGHAFNLYHTFEGDGGGGTCPATGPCTTTGDLICDTEPHKRSQFNCPTGINPCTGISYNNVVNNYMDYSSKACQNRFTAGQRTRWIQSLTTMRAGLLSSLGTIAPTTPAVASACSNITLAGPTATVNSYDAGPEKVEFANMVATTDGGYVSDGNRSYLDFTCSQQANLVQGSSYTLKVTTGAGIGNRVRGWIDLNNDGTFSSTEQIMNSNGSGTTFSSSPFTVPSTVTFCTPLRMRVIVDRNTTTTTINPCGPLYSGQAEDYRVVIKPLTTVALAVNPSPSCAGSSVTVTATPSVNAVSPTYVWYKNNTVVTTGVSGNTYTTTGFANGDVVKAKMYFSTACGTDSMFSLPVTIVQSGSVTPGVTVAISSGPACAGQPITFTATPSNGGTAPTYIWKVTPTGGSTTTVQTGASATYTSSTLSAGDTVRVQMISNSSCAPGVSVTSLPVPIVFTTVTAAVTISQTSGTVPACAGKPVAFTAVPTNGGTAPTYQWMVNGTVTSGASGAVFSYIPANGDVVRAILSSSIVCVSNAKDTSNAIGIITVMPDTSSIAVAITKGSNPGCKDSLIEFTATTANFGSNIGYTWYVNGIVSSTTSNVFSSSTFQNGDAVSVRAIALTNGCRTSDTVYSSPVALSLGTPPAAPVISFIGNQLIANGQNVQWYGPNGAIPGATSSTYHPTSAGLYYARNVSVGCQSMPSNRLQVSLLSVGSLDLTGVSIYPNPTTGTVTLDWGGRVTTATLDVYSSLGQHLQHDVLQQQASKKLDLSSYPSGNYFLLIRNANGEAATVPVSLQR
jgi:hypothetical protein